MGDQFGWTPDSYRGFIGGKFSHIASSGIVRDSLPDSLFDHQRVLTKWALRKGRAAIFADTGLGKTRMQLVWADEVARATECPVLILAPLAVAEQTCAEARSIGIDARRAYSEDDGGAVVVTNYDRVHLFDHARYGGVVLDESSIIKHHDSKTFAYLTDAFMQTPYKLCATATPAPNDWMELGTHAEFLGVKSRTEMLAEYFTHDGGETQKWRLKGHARVPFWQWVSSWGAMIRSPADLGFDASAYELPPLTVREHMVDCGEWSGGDLFMIEASSLSERRDARRSSINERVAACADAVNGDDSPWVIWCELNAESDALTAAIPDAVEVRGSDDSKTKADRMMAFSRGEIRVLVTKPKIAGFGMNWQHCANVAFVGVTDSFESYYQSIRRCWRFGQTRRVKVHIFSSEAEGAVKSNLKRKEIAAMQMLDELSRATREAVQCEVLGASRPRSVYSGDKPVVVPGFLR